MVVLGLPGELHRLLPYRQLRFDHTLVRHLILRFSNVVFGFQHSCNPNNLWHIVEIVRLLVVDIGFVGKDTLDDVDFEDYYELLDLEIGKCYATIPCKASFS